eukprot:COSAG02_NODE_3193_length_7196_cov_3.188812_6_plen_201_part_00
MHGQRWEGIPTILHAISQQSSMRLLGSPRSPNPLIMGAVVAGIVVHRLVGHRMAVPFCDGKYRCLDCGLVGRGGQGFTRLRDMRCSNPTVHMRPTSDGEIHICDLIDDKVDVSKIKGDYFCMACDEAIKTLVYSRSFCNLTSASNRGQVHLHWKLRCAPPSSPSYPATPRAFAEISRFFKIWALCLVRCSVIGVLTGIVV